VFTFLACCGFVKPTMKVCARRFNIYFAALAALVLICGCQTEKNQKPNPKKTVAALRVHLESSPSESGTTQTVSVLRANPVAVTIARDPILTEANVIAAKVIEAPGGFGIEIRFDETGSMILEQYSAANPGRHFVIFAQWGEKLTDGRWLAAPLITHRIADGVLAFTPDCSREEADQLVLGLNNVAKKIQKGYFK
ncbi:MAG: SecDF P1 head subdomain-containing protein, partial [Limisphaerales bacterium]